MLFTLYLGSLCVQALGKLTSLSDIEDPQLLITDQYVSSCYFWNTLQPTQRTRYTLKITAKPSDDELLPLAPPTIHSPASSPEHMEWPCVSAEVGEDKGCGLWSSLCPITEVLLTSSLLQTACNLLKVLMIVMDG